MATETKSTVTVNIVSRWDSSEILFSAEVDTSISEPLRIRVALEIAVKNRARLDRARLDGASLDRASLVGARLDGASLDGARLVGASLDGASLDGASLVGARLVGASLVGARLDGASLVGASLDGAHLDGARLDDGSTLTGNRPIFMLGPIGSASRTFAAYCTLQGLRLRAGCFFGTREQFLAQLNKTHGTDSAHAREYMAALAMIDAHVALWSPAEAPALLEKVAV